VSGGAGSNKHADTRNMRLSGDDDDDSRLLGLDAEYIVGAEVLQVRVACIYPEEGDSLNLRNMSTCVPIFTELDP
jgi:hypothetical protein